MTPDPPVGTARADAGAPDPDPPADVEPDPADGSEPPSEAVLGPCLSAEAALAWAHGRGADVVAGTLARYLTDLTPEGRPEVTAEQAAGWIRTLEAYPLLDAECASLVAAFWFDPRGYDGPRAGTGPGQGLAVFGPALTEPVVFFSACADGRQTCSVVDVEDIDGDTRGELLLETVTRGGPAPVRTLYTFPDDVAPLPLWVSDDDAVRQALFGADGDLDAGNQARLESIQFSLEGGVSRLRGEYRLLYCEAAEDGAYACEPTGAQTLVFTRLGDVYLLPGEPEPGAEWGQPADSSDREAQGEVGEGE